MAFRLPGADTEDGYWQQMLSGRSRVRLFSDAELATSGIPVEARQAPEFTGASAPLADVELFDAGFFQMSAREAAITDPQKRLMLECCYHALENGGYGGAHRDARIGVYASSGYGLYSLHNYLLNNLPAEIAAADWAGVKQLQVGNLIEFTASKISFFLGLTGPSVSISTACSSSMVSLDVATTALRSGDADMALVASCAIHIPVVTGTHWVKGSILSRSGAVRPFDAAADGTVGGNGVVALLLKPLDRALADGDTVHAVILGSGVTNDGDDKIGFARPSVSGQRDAVLRALETAGVSAESIGYLEAHGTGTFKGDPIEFAALTEAYRRHTDRTGFCALGAAKAVIGHLDSCAGLAGLVTAVLALRHGVVPPVTNFTKLNPLLELADSPFTISGEARAWPKIAGPRRAGVHSVGMGGTNAHVIVEQAPPASPRQPAQPGRAPRLLPLSAHTPAALREQATAFLAYLTENPAVEPADVAVSAAFGRRLLRHRLALVGPPERWPAALEAYLAGAAGGYVTGSAIPDATPAVLFAGQGSASPAAAAALAARFPAAAEVLAACEQVYRECAGPGAPDLSAVLLTGQGPRDWETDLAQPALFALQAAQLRVWTELGVTPRAVAGHSVGELAALHAAGALSLPDGMRLACLRGSLMQRTAPGAMVAVFAADSQTAQLRAAVPGLEVAVINSGSQHVLAGPVAAVERATELLRQTSLGWERLAVSRAFHTALIDPVLEELYKAAAQLPITATVLPFISGLDGQLRPPGWQADADYLVAQARQPVRFDRVLATLAELLPDGGPLLEIGPAAVLTSMVTRALPEHPALPTRRSGAVRNQAPELEQPDPAAPGLEALWHSIARLHVLGVEPRWPVLLAGSSGRRIPLPRYPFQRAAHWIGPRPVLDPPDRRDRPPVRPEQERDATPPEEHMSELSVLDRVVQLTAQHLGFQPDDVGPDQPFVELGADSLQLIAVLRQLEAEFVVVVSMRELLEDAGTPRLTARLIASRSDKPAPPAAAAPPGAASAPALATWSAPAAPAPAALTPAAPLTPPAAAAPPAAVTWTAPVPVASVPAPVGPAAAAPAGPAPSGDAVAELARQVQALAETQAHILTQLSQVVALVAAERGGVSR